MDDEHLRRTALTVTELVVVGEGFTEESFIKRMIAPTLAEQAVYVTARLLRTSRRGRGGALSTDRVLHHLPRVIKERDDVYVSTFFDLYGLASDFPGVSVAKALSDPIERAAAIEAAFGAAVVEAAGCRPERFLPHVQPYEFESLLFADVSAFADTRSTWHTCVTELRDMREAVATPEHINDGLMTHPSARLGRVLNEPRYDKRLDGPAVAARIGLDRIRADCRHFGRWLGRLETLPPLRREPIR